MMGPRKTSETITHSPAETHRLAATLAGGLAPGSCIALSGELGAGKTQFVRGLVEGLGGEGRMVSSPTFVLLNVYDTPRMKVYHLDAYRVGADDFEAIGFPELLEQGGVVVVEWPQRVADLLPKQRIDVQIEILSRRRRLITLGAGWVAQDTRAR